MQDSLYDVVTAGHAVAGAVVEDVQQRLVSQLKLTPQRAALLLAGKPVTVKKAVTRDVAERYCRHLQALGLAARIEAVAAPTDDSAASHFSFPHLPQPARPLRYWLALARCASHSLAIAAVYFALIALAVGAWLWFAIAAAPMLRQPPLWWYGPLYCLPLLAGALLLPLLLRPLLAPSAPRPVSPPAPTACSEFVSAVATACHMPAPAGVELDPGCAVTAILAPGWRGLARRPVFHLTVGLPLLQNLDQAQLAGEIARALSPLTHPLTRCSLRLNQFIAERCARCIRGEDWLARWLQALAEHDHPAAIATALRAARFLSQWTARPLGRGVGWAVRARAQTTGELAADADRWQVAAAGSAIFAATLVTAHKLAAAQTDALRHNREEGATAGLVDNLPALIQHYLDHLDADFERTLRTRWEQEFARGGEHAIPRERIATAEAAAQPGLPITAAPAAALLADLDALQRQVTEALYATPPYQFAGAARRSTAAAQFAASEELSRRELAAVYFNGWFRRDRFWALPDYTLIKAMPVADAAMQLHVCVNEIRRLTPDRLRLLAGADRLQQEIDDLLLGQQLAAAGQPPARQETDPAGMLADRRQRLAAATEQLATQEAIMGGRIALALRLAGLDAGDGEDLHGALTFLHGEQARLQRLGADLRLLDQLRERLQRRAGERGPRELIARLEQKIADTATRLAEKLKNVPNPLDTPHLSMGEYVQAQLARVTTAERPRQLLDQLHRLHEKLALVVAEHGSTAEAAYRTERIKLIDTERSAHVSDSL